MLNQQPPAAAIARNVEQHQEARDIEEQAILARERAANNDDDDDDDDDDEGSENGRGEDLEGVEGQQEQQEEQPRSPHDPSRMSLTSEELQWALAIKAAIEGGGEPDIDPVSDLMYAQLALLERDDVEAAVDRARAVQVLRQEYGIMDTLADGRQYLPGIIDLCPGVYLNYSFNSLNGNYALVLDIANFDMASISTPDRVTRWLKGGYYLFHVLNPDLAAMRNGLLFLYETQGYDWKNSMDTHAFRKVWTELGATYPTNYHQIKYFHTGMFLNLLLSMGRRFIPRRIHEKIQIGCQFDARLDTIYHVPSVEVAEERIKRRLLDSLQKRYEHERTFSLATAKVVPISQIED